MNGLYPSNLKEDIFTDSSSTRYNTRSGDRACVVPRIGSFGSRKFVYTAIKLWNSLPFTIQTLTNKCSYKSHVKKFLWDQIFRVDHDMYLYY